MTINDAKLNFKIDTIEPFLEHLRANGYPDAQANIDDVELLAGGRSRTTLKLSTNEGDFVAQVQHKNHLLKLEHTVAFQKHIHDAGIPTPEHVGDIGNYDQDHKFEMTHFMEHESVAELSPTHIKQIATTLAKLHIAGKDFIKQDENKEREKM